MARNGAAKVLLDVELGEKLVPTLLELLDDAPSWQALGAMRESARSLARPDAAKAIAGQLRALACVREAARRWRLDHDPS
jgi:UDP-N-acetylglucosamine:LPS N-acetylglucosamine transferase